MRLFALIIMMLCIAAPATAQELTVLTHNSRGQTYIDNKGEMRGAEHAGKRAFYVEVVREIMLRLDMKPTISEVPFKKGFQLVTHRPGYVFFNVSRTQARENLVKWVGPLEKEMDFFYAKKGFGGAVKTMSDARNAGAICVLDGGVHQSLLTRKGFTNLVPAPTYAECFTRVFEGRADLTPSAQSSVAKKLALAGLAKDAVEATPVMVSESCGCIAFSKSTPDEVIRQWQTMLVRLVSSGAYEQLYQKYYLPAQ